MAIEIQLSKTKLIKTLLGSMAFVGIGCWFLIAPPQSDHGFFSNPALVKVIGVASIVFFGIAGIYVFKKLSDKAPGLVISEDGIVDNASAISAGFIPWTDIEAINEIAVVNQKFINVIVKNPQEYIDKQKSALKRQLVQVNLNQYGSVISIPAVSLKCEFDELKAMIDKGFAEFKASQAKI